MPESTIANVAAHRVWDSRGLPTVEVRVGLENGRHGRAIAPSGASRGTREAVDLRDGGASLAGKNVGHALRGVREEIAPALIGMDALDQSAIDRKLIELDGTPDKGRLGGNALVAASLAVLNAAACSLGLALWRYVADTFAASPAIPLPEIQIFGGGAHAGRRIDIQDFMVMVPGAASLEEALAVTAEVYIAAGEIMRRRSALQGVADEGGWWPVFRSNEEGLATLLEAIERAGETPGQRVVISLDVAASEFAHDGRYRLGLEGRELDSDGMIETLGAWLRQYPIVSVEDPMDEADIDGMQTFTRRYGGQVQIVGDDFLVTNAALIERAGAANACNAVLAKVNQAGTVTETVDALAASRRAGFGSIVSARSGESEDVCVAHLAVGFGAGQLKVGSIARGERTAKWNECLRIAQQGHHRGFVGGQPLAATWWGREHGDTAIQAASVETPQA